MGTSHLAEKAKLETIKILGQGLGVIIGIYVVYRRARASDKIAQAHHNANEQKLFNDASAKLSDESASVRLGGIYALDTLARSNETYLTRIVEILCAHLRETTQQKGYQEKYKDKPSNEIQSLANVLSELNKVLSVLNSQKEKNGNSDFLRLDLSASYLVGADLTNACLKYVNLVETDLQQAFLDKAQLQKANLRIANMQRASLRGAQMQMASLVYAHMENTSCRAIQLQGADLHGTHLNGAKLRGAQMQMAILNVAWLQQAKLAGAQLQKASLQYAQLQMAFLDRAQMQGAILHRTQLQGAELGKAQLQGAELKGAQLQGADLSEAQLQGAYLSNAQLQGANLSKAQLQEVDLRNAQIQGAELREAQLQGAELSDVDLRGAYCQSPDGKQLIDLPRRIKERQNKRANLTTVIFSGELSQENARRIRDQLTECQKNGWMTKEKVGRIIAILEEHQGKPAINKPPSGIKTGSYDKKEADAIIKEYEKETAGMHKIYSFGD